VHRRASVPSYPHHHRSMVDYVTRPWSTARGPSPRDVLYENNSLFPVYSEILQKGPQTFGYSSRGLEVLQSDPWFLKNNSREVPSPKKNPQNSPQNFKRSYLSNHNSKFSDSCAKIPRITSSLTFSIRNTHVCCIYLLFVFCLR
jgi:hypothetical protein